MTKKSRLRNAAVGGSVVAPYFRHGMAYPNLVAPSGEGPRRTSSRNGRERREPYFRQTPPARRGSRGFGRILLFVVLILVGLPAALILVFRVVPPPVTALMLIRFAEGEPLQHRWVPLDHISPALQRAVVASEDEKFCSHHGFDWQAMDTAWRDWRAGRDPKGASTITMQTAKNLFLWPGRSVIRKGFEAYLTVLIELMWDKHRIIEVYLNVIEWGDGLYGAETAGHTFFNKPATALTAQEAALLAAVLPNPRRWSPAQPTSYIAERAATIRERMSGAAIPGPGCR
jgi:monofunctional biosynthetic peptidoglycan transglycosylase